MSKIKWGAIVVDGRGKLGGHVFTKTRSGATMRTKVTPVNPQTTAQAAARSRLATNSQAWRTLTEAQRIAWNGRADEIVKTNIFGDNYKSTGKNTFTMLNNNLMLIGQSPLINPPVMVPIPAVTGLSLYANVALAKFEVNADYDGIADGTVLVIEATSAYSAGRFNFDGSFRVISQIADYDGVLVDIMQAYISKFGPLVQGTKIGVRCFFISQSSGLATPRFSAQTIVV